MTSLKNESDIWELKPKNEDIEEAIHYATISWPYTFNRMNFNVTSYKGQQGRVLNIVKGITNQNILKRELSKNKIKIHIERKSYREEDLFDFRIVKDNLEYGWDVKTIHHYGFYDKQFNREPLSKSLIIKNKSYDGPIWLNFFPMLVTHTQVNQQKDGYIFGISSTYNDIRSDRKTQRNRDYLVFVPWGLWATFMADKRLVYAREKENKGFSIKIVWKDILPLGEKLKINVIGERKGQRIDKIVKLSPNSPKTIGPFSSITAIQLLERETLIGKIVIYFNNRLNKPVLISKKKNINIVPKYPLIITDEHLINLYLPIDYRVLFVGWIKKQDFLNEFKKYRAWIWPDDKTDQYKNSAWSQPTEKDLDMLHRYGFLDLYKDKKITGGILKTTGKGNGACCYVFQNQYGGGVRETNFYVLPQDLYRMTDFVGY